MLAHGSKVVLPIEIAFHTHRLTTFQEELNKAVLREALDLLFSIRGDILLREALYKLRITCFHDRAVGLSAYSCG